MVALLVIVLCFVMPNCGIGMVALVVIGPCPVIPNFGAEMVALVVIVPCSVIPDLRCQNGCRRCKRSVFHEI